LDQHQLVLIVAVIAVVAVVGVIGFFLGRKRRTQQLRQRFGPEYDRVLKKEGQVARAEGVLDIRAKRRDKFALHPLTEATRADFAERWRLAQSHFVDDPKASVSEADQVVNQLMQTRGYPMADFEQRTADISVDHPVVVENYRAGHDIALRDSRGQATTEDLRKAMVHYRTLFEELLGDVFPQRKEARA
jgi:FtsZ-interacting cell division protein ZipA